MFDKKPRKQDVLAEDSEQFEHGNRPQTFEEQQGISHPADPKAAEEAAKATADQLKALQDKAQPVVLVPAPTVQNHEAQRLEAEAAQRRADFEESLKHGIVGIHSSEQKASGSYKNVGKGGSRTVKPV